MPLFGKKKKGKEDTYKENLPDNEIKCDASTTSTSNGATSMASYIRRPKFSFQCQLAQGSPTGLISGFSNIKELYDKLADCYELEPDSIMFCTLNTHKIDMDRLLGSHIGMDDFIFVHVKGAKKEVDLIKSDESLGLTITDNGCGKAVVKRIRDASQIQKLGRGLIDVGDHIERINDESFLGKRHYDVARRLRSIPVGEKFVVRLISPEKSVYSNLTSRSDYSNSALTNIVSGKKTLRFTNNGNIVEEEDSNTTTMDEQALEIIMGLVEKSIGISEPEIAKAILETGKQCKNPTEFWAEINADMGDFQFPQSLLNDFWGVVSDSNVGLLRHANGNHGDGTLSSHLTPSSSSGGSSGPVETAYEKVLYEGKI